MYPRDSQKNWFDGKGHWNNLPDEKWNDWRWQMKHRIKNVDGFSDYLRLSDSEIKGLEYAENRLSVAVTPYFLNLVDPFDPECPIRKQIMPVYSESVFKPEEVWDPVGEEKDMPVSCVVHRYPDRVLFLVTDRCAAYCRYCTRSRVVSGAGSNTLNTDFEQAFQYLENTPSIRDVLFSGGDPLLYSDDKLEKIISRIHKIKHIEFIRIGTRIPIFLPQRITPSLCNMLKKYHPLWMSIHTNHPKELTLEVKQALEMLADSGIPLGNQSVLLKDINDDISIMKSLVHKLLKCRVRPYYLYQCDLIEGSSHLRTPAAKGIEIIEGLRGHTSGYSVPQFVIDAPGGGGKIPINPEYVVEKNPEQLKIRNYEGKSFIYPEPKNFVTNPLDPAALIAE